MSLHVAVSGVKTASADLNVIGNNIANASTTGFKQARAEFADVYAVSNLGTAKTNPGSGVRLSRTAQQFNQANISVTGSSLDLAINGNGFFLLDDNGTRLYTRAGNFGLDREGFVINADDKKLITYGADSDGNIVATLGPLKITTANLAPKPTTKLSVGINLDARSPVIDPAVAFDPLDPKSYNNMTSTTIYDSLGSPHTAVFYYRKTGDNAYDTHVLVDDVDQGTDTLTFTTSGKIDTVNGDNAAPKSFTKTFQPTGGSAQMTLTFSYAEATQHGAAFSVNALTQDGYTSGQLSSLDIDKKGMIFGRFSNGQSRVEGQLPLANFTSPQGLLPVGDTNWVETFASGQPLIGEPGTSQRGVIQSGALEESNVDLSAELVKLIVAQRNFQANTQVIRADDTVTQAIINIR